MSASNESGKYRAGKRRLPQQPSEENLKKQAKRRSRLENIPLAKAQHHVAVDYGFRSWPKLVTYVESVRKESGEWRASSQDNLPKAANKGDVTKVKIMLAAGQFTQHDLDLALGRIVCNMGEYSQTERWLMADLLIEAGADPDGEYGGNYGPIILAACEGINLDGIQYLLKHGADISFGPIQTKNGEHSPMSHLLGSYVRGRIEEKHKIIDIILSKSGFVPLEVTPELLAIHRGDATMLREMLDADVSLSRRTFHKMPYGNIHLAGSSLMHCAVEFGEIECVDAIFRHEPKRQELCINCKAEVIDGIGGQTPIFHAINTNGDGNYSMLQYLVHRMSSVIDMTVKATWRCYGKSQDVPLTPLQYAKMAKDELDPKWAHFRPRVNDEIELLTSLAAER